MDTEQSPGFGDYFSALRRRRRLVFGVGVPIAVGAIVVALALPAYYRSQAMFEIEEAKLANYIPNASKDARPVAQLDQYVASLAETVLIDAKLGRAVQEVNPFPGDSRTKAIAELRKATQLKMVKRKILDPFSGRDRDVISGFTISFDHHDPAVAKAGAMWLANAFAQANREQARERAESAAGFLANEAERMRARIGESEQKLAEFKSKNVGRLPDQAGMNMELMDRSSRDLENVEMQVRTLQRDRIFIQQQLMQAQANPQADNIRELEAEYARRATTYDDNHPDMIALRKQIEIAKGGGPVDAQSLQAQMDALKSVLAATRQRYSDDHPDVKKLQRQIDQLQERIAKGETGGASAIRRTPIIVQLQTQLNATDTQIAGLQAQAGMIRGKVNDFETKLTTSPEVEREYQQMTRDLQGARDKYQQLVNQQMDAELSESAIAGGRGDEFRMVQTPGEPRSPSGPPRIAIGLLGVLGAALFAAIAAFVAESIDPSIRGTLDLRRILRVTPLAVIPEIETAEVVARRRTQALTLAGAVAAASVVLFVAVRFVA
jgi:uncharacterized protein involved in exopolysaccharide biosynthesis